MTKYKHNLKINQGAKAARFVVDLKNDLPREEAVAVAESKLEKLAELDYGKMYKTGKAKTRTLARGFWIPACAGMTKISAGMTKGWTGMTKKWEVNNGKNNEIASSPGSSPGLKAAPRNDKLYNQLAFVEISKALYNLFYKICYGAGWVIMFAVRLVYLIALAVIKKFWILACLRRRACAGMTKREAGMARKKKKELAKFIPTPHLMRGRDPRFPPAARNDRYAAGYLKPVLVFAGILLIIILPVKAFTYYKSLDSIKGRVLGASASAMSDLLAGGQSAANFDFNQADKSFTQASANFLTAQKRLDNINGLIFTLASIAPDKNIRLAAAGKHILKAGELSSAAGKNLSLALAEMFDDKGRLVFTGRPGAHLHKAAGNLSGLAGELNQIDSDLIPAAYQKNFILLKQKAFELNGGFNQFIELADNLAIFLGAERDKRYLLVFQNNSELRASGGFIGSYAIMDFSQGQIKNIEAPGGGSYDTDAGLLKKIKSPEPLRVVRPDWHFWDANWWPDWPTSARKLAWFYENSGGSTVDGVISLTPTVMERLLKITGPIDMSQKYGIIFDADNFWLETQKLSEQKPDVTKQPKKIIGDLMKTIISELPKRLNQGNLPGLLKAARQSLDDKNILFYFADSNLENLAAKMGWDGKIKDAPGDYLSVINTNIAGGKSDRKIDQQISHQAEVQADGTIMDTLTVRRTHTGARGEPFSGVRNVDWMRIYAPAGSELISAAGFKPLDRIFFKPAEAGWLDDPDVAAGQNGARTDEATKTIIYEELGKTVFANWSQIDPGETVEIIIKYKLPFKLTEKKSNAAVSPARNNLYTYMMLIQKQPGMNSSDLASELKLSDNFHRLWQSDDLSISQALTSDITMAALVEKK